jgi:hypothetical protein
LSTRNTPHKANTQRLKIKRWNKWKLERKVVILTSDKADFKQEWEERTSLHLSDGNNSSRRYNKARYQWIMPVILNT